MQINWLVFIWNANIGLIWPERISPESLISWWRHTTENSISWTSAVAMSIFFFRLQNQTNYNPFTGTHLIWFEISSSERALKWKNNLYAFSTIFFGLYFLWKNIKWSYSLSLTNYVPIDILGSITFFKNSLSIFQFINDLSYSSCFYKILLSWSARTFCQWLPFYAWPTMLLPFTKI